MGAEIVKLFYRRLYTIYNIHYTIYNIQYTILEDTRYNVAIHQLFFDI